VGPDPTRACFWSIVNKKPTCLWPRYFLTRPEDIFFDSGLILDLAVFAKFFNYGVTRRAELGFTKIWRTNKQVIILFWNLQNQKRIRPKIWNVLLKCLEQSYKYKGCQEISFKPSKIVWNPNGRTHKDREKDLALCKKKILKFDNVVHIIKLEQLVWKVLKRLCLQCIKLKRKLYIWKKLHILL